MCFKLNVGTGGNTGKTVAIILGGAAGVGFLVICLLFTRNLMKKHDGMYVYLEHEVDFFLPAFSVFNVLTNLNFFLVFLCRFVIGEKMRFKRSKSSFEVDSFYNIIFVFG